MANPRQRRKAKSSAHRPVSHSKRAKRLLKKMPAIRGPKALQDAWDSSKTVRQNYLALGLQDNLNPIPSGGSEVNLSRPGTTDPVNTHGAATSSAVDRAPSSPFEAPTGPSGLPKGFGRIVKDPAGNIIRVELPSDEGAGRLSRRELEIDAPVMPESELRIWAHDRPETWEGAGPRSMKDTIVQDLETLAASAIGRERHTSQGERLYLERLVSKHGDDLDKMARDRRFNPSQRTANELKKAIAKAGGFEALYKSTATEVAG